MLSARKKRRAQEAFFGTGKKSRRDDDPAYDRKTSPQERDCNDCSSCLWRFFPFRMHCLAGAATGAPFPWLRRPGLLRGFGSARAPQKVLLVLLLLLLVLLVLLLHAVQAAPH